MTVSVAKANECFKAARASLQSACEGYAAGKDVNEVCQHLDDVMTDCAKLLEMLDAESGLDADESE